MKQQRLVALVLFGFLALTYPLISLFNLPILISGFPLLYLYLFAIWVALIGLIVVVTPMPGE